MFVMLRLLGYLFFPVVILYSGIIYLRNKFYDWNLFKSFAINSPLLSVGNIQLGGTGKTPLTEYLAKKIHCTGKKAVILSRGYRRKGRGMIIVDDHNRSQVKIHESGDEPYLLTRNLPGVMIGIHHDRYKLAKEITRKISDVVFIMDDGFQHRKLKRDLDIVLIDVTRWSRLPILFPMSYFRDVKSSLRRAGIVILTRTEDIPWKTELVEKEILSLIKCPLLKARINPAGLVKLNSKELLPLKTLKDKKIAAFCGLANAQQFYNMVNSAGGVICWKKSFSDHHFYSISDWKNIRLKFRQCNADFIITTQKDIVKFEEMDIQPGDNFYYLTLKLEIENEEPLTRIIESILNKH